MFRIIMVLTVLFSMSGCRGVNRVIWGEDTDPSKRSAFDFSTPIDNDPLQGSWGGFVNVAGMNEHFSFLIDQNGSNLDGIFFGGSSGFRGTIIDGLVNGNTFSFTLDEGTACTNKWSVTGTYSGKQMTVTVVGIGNSSLGNSCHPFAINSTVNLSTI